MTDAKEMEPARPEPGRVTDTPPCEHNLWLRLRVRYNLRYTRLECLECKKVWCARLGDFAKCSEFYAGGCSLGAKCPNPHVVSPAAAKFMKPGELPPPLKEIKKLLKKERDTEKMRAARERKQAARVVKAADTVDMPATTEQAVMHCPPPQAETPMMLGFARSSSFNTSPLELSLGHAEQVCGISSSGGSEVTSPLLLTRATSTDSMLSYRHEPYSFTDSFCAL